MKIDNGAAMTDAKVLSRDNFDKYFNEFELRHTPIPYKLKDLLVDIKSYAHTLQEYFDKLNCHDMLNLKMLFDAMNSDILFKYKMLFNSVNEEDEDVEPRIIRIIFTNYKDKKEFMIDVVYADWLDSLIFAHFNWDSFIEISFDELFNKAINGVG